MTRFFFVNVLNNDTDLLVQSELNFMLVCPVKYHFYSVNNYFLFAIKVQSQVSENAPKFADKPYNSCSKFQNLQNNFSTFKTNNEPFSCHNLLK